MIPGLPITIELSGTSKLTKAPAAISTLLPIQMFPQTIELAYRVTLLAIVGTPFLVPDSIAPITHPLYKVTFYLILPDH